MEEHGIPKNSYNQHAWIIHDPEIGEGTWIGAFTVIDGMGGLKIGRHCNVSCGAHIITHSTVKRCITEGRYPEIEKAPTVIEDHVFIGEHATVLMGSHIGHHSVIAAGTVVKEGTVVPPFSLVAGVPGRIIRGIEHESGQWALQAPREED